MMLKKIIITVFCLLPGILVCSQERHEVSVSVSGGMHTINYTPAIGHSNNKMGSTIGIGYNYRLTSSWSIGSGVEMLIAQSEFSIDNLLDSYAANDGEDDFIFHTTINGYTENQSISYMNIPFIVTFQQSVSTKNSFYASAGFKFGIPVVQRIDVDASFNNFGYYPKWENPIKDDPYFMGFGDFEAANEKGHLELNTLYSLSVEGGIKWTLNDKLNLYSGVYCDYGLNNIQKVSDKRVIQYNNVEPSDYIHNSVINSSYTNDENLTRQFADKANLITVGLKLRLSLSL